MSSETVDSVRTLAIYNDRGLAAVIGLAKTVAFLDAVEAQVPPRVTNWLATVGIDLAHPDTVAQLTLIDPPHLADVMALLDETRQKYGPNFRKGHLQNARQYRLKGAI